MILRRSTSIAAAVLGIALMAAPSAMASTGTGSFTASCNSGYDYESNDVYYNHATSGTMKLQNRSDKTVVQRLYSSTGKVVGASTKASGSTSSWTGVLAGRYKAQAKISADTNCNGILPGYGNFTYSYTITY